RVRDPIQSALAQSREVQRRLAQRFGRNGAGIDARAAEVRLALDESDSLAEVGGLRGALLAGGAPADHDPVVAIHARLTLRREASPAHAWRCYRGSLSKRYKLASDQIRPLARGRGSCLASDHITVDGLSVGFMYREEPDTEFDSGWRFLSGLESDAYVNDLANVGLHDINTIANYDPAVIPLLGPPPGWAFERGGGGLFLRVDFEPRGEGGPAARGAPGPRGRGPGRVSRFPRAPTVHYAGTAFQISRCSRQSPPNR